MPKKFRLNHNLRHIPQSKTYTVDEICDLLGVHSRTAYAWLKGGLESISGSYPKLVHGSKLVEFLKKKKEARRIICQHDEFCCFTCKAARKPLPDSITQTPKNKTVINLRAICSICGGVMFKTISTKSAH